jgi:hypothetical protein
MPVRVTVLRRLIVALGASFIISLDRVAIRRSYTRESAGEFVCLTVAQTDRVEVKRHSGPASQASTLGNRHPPCLR